jgi:hypothetical protein
MTKPKKLPEQYRGTIIETMDRTLADSFQVQAGTAGVPS